MLFESFTLTNPISRCGAVGSAPALGALLVASTAKEAAARKALQHGRLRDLAGTENRAEKRS